MTLGASWYLRAIYVAPWLAVCVVIAVIGGPEAVAIPSLVMLAAGIRAVRIGVTVNHDGLKVRNFWMSYRIRPEEIIRSERRMRLRPYGSIRGPYSVVVLDLKSGAGVAVMASAFFMFVGERHGRTVEQVMNQLLGSVA